MKKAIALLGTAILLALGACSPADATPVALDDPCVTKEEALSAIHDWSPDASEVVLSSKEVDLFKAWHATRYGGVPDGDLWVMGVTWEDNQTGVLVGVVNSEGCIAMEVTKIKQEAWDLIMNGLPL